MVAFIDPTKLQHVFMTIAPRDTQFPYKVIGIPGHGFVPEADFKSVVHELANTKQELNALKREVEKYEMNKAPAMHLPKDAAAHSLWAEIFKLRYQIAGPDGFVTWKDAAVDERQRRVKLEQELGKLRVTLEPAFIKLRDQAEADKKRNLEIEAEAEIIYNGWKEDKGWTPWVKSGNSHMQERARDLARSPVSASDIAEVQKHDTK